MSTILNTLRKLEEEKSILDQSLDIKSIVTSPGHNDLPRADTGRPVILALMILTIVSVLGAGIWFGWNKFRTTPTLATVAQIPEPDPSASKPALNKTAPVTERSRANDSVSGFPLSAIPGKSMSAEQSTVPEKSKTPDLPDLKSSGAAKAKSPEPVQPVIPPVALESVAESPLAIDESHHAPETSAESFATETISTAQTEPQEEDSKKERKLEILESAQSILPLLEQEALTGPSSRSGNARIHDLINNVRIAAGEKSQPKPSTPKGHIPDLSIKGIIFLGKDNPANYILISSPETSRKKLKAGEKAGDAVLESIQSDSAVFRYEGRFLTVGMGN